MNPALSLSDQNQTVRLSIFRISNSLKLNPVIPMFPETVPFYRDITRPIVVNNPQDTLGRVAIVLMLVLEESEHRSAVLVYSQIIGD